MSAGALTAGVTVAGSVVTVAVAVVPALRFAYEAPALRIVLETGNALIAFCVAYLVYGRFRVSGRVRDLLLATALAVVALTNLVLTALPAAVLSATSRELTEWIPLAVRLLGTALIAVAALVPSTVVTVKPRLARNGLLVGLVVLGLVALGYALGERLPPPVALSLIHI